jgi:multidrug efflux pump subunit AcrA (membrane-fusion protein)
MAIIDRLQDQEEIRTPTVLERPSGEDLGKTPQNHQRPRAEDEARSTHWLLQQVPNLVVLILLGVVAWYGHQSGWKLPKFSALAGSASPEEDDWCDEHSVPESACVLCDPELFPRGPDYGWCEGHGVHHCPLEHPDVVQLKQVPEIPRADLDRAARALAIAPRATNNSNCTNYQRLVQFASREAMEKAGIQVAPVARQAITEAIVAVGEISYDQTRFAKISSRAAGTVAWVLKNVGDRVEAGEILAVVDAAEVGRAKSELVRALAEEALQEKALGRLASLASSGVVAERRAQEAEADYVRARAAVLEAQQTLANLGLPVDLQQLRGLSQEELLARLQRLGLPELYGREPEGWLGSANALPIRSPIPGVIVSREAVAGEVVNPSQVLFQVADISRMWLTLNVPLEKAGQVKLGQPVRFRPEGTAEEVIGTVSWISTSVDPQTRLLAVRAELPNPNGHLRDKTFGLGQIVLREEPDAIVVPNEAVHWEGCCHVVFVRDKNFVDGEDTPKLFHVRSVRVGVRTDRYTEIVAGVWPGEIVATQGSDALRAELLKSNLGEGCAEGG